MGASSGPWPRAAKLAGRCATLRWRDSSGSTGSLFICLSVCDLSSQFGGESKGIPIWITDFFQVRGKDDVQKFRSSEVHACDGATKNEIVPNAYSLIMRTKMKSIAVVCLARCSALQGLQGCTK